MAQASRTVSVTDSRSIRVFISSTFRDMKRERDLLVKEVFPELRRKCARRFVTFTEVDLRWGITEEQANEGQVLPLCLAEIERSRPFFIGILGQRYGWIPDSISAEVIAREPWLREHVQGRTSVTELEVLHGVLNNPRMQGHAFFYFRDPGYVESVPPSERGDYRAEGQEQAARLLALKNEIRASGLPMVESYPNPDALAKHVHDQFDALIDQLYPEAEVPGALAQERLAHEAHGVQKLFACIERPVHLAAIDAFAEGGRRGAGLVVTGESGAGKSALLAEWIRRWGAAHEHDFVFQHYCGATPESASTDGLLRRLLGELKRRFTIRDEIPEDARELREAVPAWLARTTRHDRVVLLIDGLNQLQGTESDQYLGWMPRQLPENVLAITSALAGPALSSLATRGWSTHEVPEASPDEVVAMVDAYLGMHARALDPALRTSLVTAPGARNPLFLRTVLEELRQAGTFELLPALLARYLEAATPRELFRRVLLRWQDDFDAPRPGAVGPARPLVRQGMTQVWAARDGVSETEWLELLGTGGEPLPQAFWSPLFLALEPHLVQRKGLYAFGHDFLRQAVEELWLVDEEARRAAHLEVADYFESHPHQQEMSPRKSAEWPYQLRRAEAWDRLEACLTDLSLFQALCDGQSAWALIEHWLPLRARGRDLGECYVASYDRWSADPARTGEFTLCLRLGQFLATNACYPAAASLLDRSLATRERILGPDDWRVAVGMHELGRLYAKQGKYEQAQDLYERALTVVQAVMGPDDESVGAVLASLAELLCDLGRFEEAEPLMARTLEIDELKFGRDHPKVTVALNNLATLYQHKGDHARAQALLERAVEIRERSDGPSHPGLASVLGNLAVCHDDQGRPAKSRRLLERALTIEENAYGPDHPLVGTTLSNLAGSIRTQGHYDEALPLLERSLAIFEAAFGQVHGKVATILTNLGGLHEAMGRVDQAESAYQRALAIQEATLGPDHPSVANTLNHLAWVSRSERGARAAVPMLERALAIQERALGRDHPDVGNTLNNLAEVQRTSGDLACAQPFIERALEIFTRSLGPDHPLTLTSLGNLAVLRGGQGDYVQAEAILRRVLAARVQAMGPQHPDVGNSLHNLAAELDKTGKYDESVTLFERALAIFGNTLGARHPSTASTLNGLARACEHQGDPARAEQLYEQWLEICEEDPATERRAIAANLNNLAMLHEGRGNRTQAIPLYRRSLALWEAELGPDHPEVATTLNNLGWSLARQGMGTEAERLLRRSLTIRETALGPGHATTLQLMNGLAEVLEHGGRHEEARELWRRRLGFAADVPGTTPGSLRSLALDAYRLGEYGVAETLLRRALESGYEIPGTHVHLARIALVRENWAAAREHAAEAWAGRATAEPHVLPRILWLLLADAFLTGNTSEVPLLLNRFRTALGIEGAVMEWVMELVLESLRPRLQPDAHALLTALVAAASFPEGLDALDAFEARQGDAPQ